MNGLLKTITMLICFSVVFQGCEESTTEPVDTTMETPDTYEFPSRFVDGESSVSYTGQVVRNVLIKDLKSLAGDEDATEAQLLDLYNNGNGASTTTIINAGDIQDEWSDFNTSSKNLTGKIASTQLLGYGQTPDAQMKLWFAEVPNLIAANSDDTRLVQASDSLELNQMIGKGLLGLVCYYGGIDYLSKMEDDASSNGSASSDGSKYSTMEHHWDESFGYFGAARDYENADIYADDAARKGSLDANDDNLIDYLTEYNFAWATYAAKRDVDCAACTSDNDFTGTIMGAYLEGRTLIHNEASLEEITAQRTIIANTWEKMIAANIIHYAQDVNARMSDSGNKKILHSWAEMRAFAMALQYNQYKLITDTDLSEVISDMGTAPPAPATWTDYSTKLTNIVSTLKTTYSFADANITAW